MKFYEVPTEIKALEELYQTSVNEETGEIQDAETLAELESGLMQQISEKGIGLIGFFRNNELTLEMVDAEIKRLQSYKKSLKNKNENFKQYVVFNMERAGIKKIETGLGTISLRSSKSVDVFDEKLVDKKFIKQVVEEKISKTELKKAIESGEEVQGARIITKNSLSIR